MSNSLQLGKKALTIAVATATILWSVGLTSFVAPTANAASYGDLIKGTTLSTVYYYGSDGQRYAFPNEKTFFSWYPDFSRVVTISDEALANITLAGNIVYRPGSRWVKITSDAKVYAVAKDGSIRWIENEATAMGLAGATWNTFIDDVPDVFFVDYTVGDSMTSPAAGYEGMVWSDGTNNYIVWGGKISKVSAAGMSGNWFRAGSVLSGTGFNKNLLPAGTEVTGKLAFLTDAAQMVETSEYAETQQITVSLAASSPAASTLVAGQGIAHLASYTFQNPTASAVKVTNVKMHRKGVSADSTLSNLYLFNGWVRSSDSATVSSGLITWNDASGLFSIPAGGSVTIAVRSDVASGTSGQTVGLSLDPDDVSFAGAFDATGAEMSAAVHTVASVSNFGTISFAAVTNPAADGNPTPENDFRVWENNVTVGNNEAWLSVLRFRNIGSINGSDIRNWRLYVAGVQKGSAVAQQDANGYVTFDLSADPLKMNTGVHTVKVLADVVGGSTRTVTVGLRNTADAVFIEDDYDQPVLVQANSTTFSARDAAAQTLASGDITFTKKSGSPSGDLIKDASGATLASFEVKATGEPMKIESLDFQIDENSNDNTFTLRNGAIYVDGVQVGSTTAIAGDTDATQVYTRFTFGSSFVVNPGTPVVMEVKGDVYDSDGANGVEANDTIQLEIYSGAVSSNVLRMTSGSYISRPAADVEGNILTVRTGGLTTARNTSYSAQSAVAPKTTYKVGSWTITANTTEAVNLTQFDVDFSAAVSDASAAADYTNLYVTYGPVGNENTSSVKTSVSLAANTWSLNYPLAKGETIYVNAYANAATSVTDDNDGDDIITADLDVDGTTASSGTAIDGSDVSASAITWYTSGSFSTSLDGSTPVARAMAAGQTVEAGKYRYTAVRESYTIDQIQVSVGSAAAAGVVEKVELYDGATLLGSSVFNQTSGDAVVNGAALVTGLNVAVTAGSYKVITAKLVLNDIGSGLAASQQNLALALDSTRYSDSQGSVSTETTDRDGNEVRVYNSIPTFNAVDLTNSTLVNGQSRDLFKFTVTASANGPIALKQLRLPITWTDGEGADDLEVESWKLYKNGSDVSTSSSAVSIQDEDGADIEDGTGALETNDSVYVIWDSSEDVIAAGETVTYTLRGTPTAFDADSDTGDEDYFTVYLGGDSAHNGTDLCLEDSGAGDIWELDGQVGGICTAASSGNSAYNVIWSDNSGESHDASVETGSGDWANGYLLLNLDLSGETWAK